MAKLAQKPAKPVFDQFAEMAFFLQEKATMKRTGTAKDTY